MRLSFSHLKSAFQANQLNLDRDPTDYPKDVSRAEMESLMDEWNTGYRRHNQNESKQNFFSLEFALRIRPKTLECADAFRSLSQVEKPKINLVYEMHEHPEARKTKQALIRDAQGEHSTLLLEGEFPRQNWGLKRTLRFAGVDSLNIERIVGMENPESRTLSSLHSLLEAIPEDLDSKKILKIREAFLEELIKNLGLQQDVFHLMQSSKIEDPVGKLATQFYSSFVALSVTQSTTQFKTSLLALEIPDKEFIQMLVHLKLSALMGVHIHFRYSKVNDRLMIEERDEVFAAAIWKQFCEQVTRRNGLPINVLVGALHVRGLQSHLNEELHSLGLERSNDLYKTFNAMDNFHIENLRR